MPEIICKEISCRHNQNEDCLKSVVVLEKAEVPYRKELVFCLQYEERMRPDA